MAIEVPERLIKKERKAKETALKHLEMALLADERFFGLKLIDDDTVEVTDLMSGYSRKVNVHMDNVPAMLFDVLKQAADWIM